ncbi:hypothetical protein GCM10019017_03870 [Streptomyces showdoensis]
MRGCGGRAGEGGDREEERGEQDQESSAVAPSSAAASPVCFHRVSLDACEGYGSASRDRVAARVRDCGCGTTEREPTAP